MAADQIIFAHIEAPETSFRSRESDINEMFDLTLKNFDAILWKK
jgi:hypothetical protein